MPFLETGGFHPINAHTLKFIQNPGFWAASLASLALSAAPAQAQNITLDGTLGNSGPIPTRANVNVNFDTIYDIRENLGQIRGSNLFHSFGRFNLVNREAAVFYSSPAIQNIFSRVTGGSVSDINGLIQTQSRSVNLFLINPAGIVFGPNAQLNLGGSFTATTANALQFGNLGNFSASQPTPPNDLLTINPSAYLFNQITPGRIVNQSVANNVNGGLGLQVPNGQSLTLLGGEVEMPGGRVTAQGGRVELGAVAGVGRVEILAGGGLGFELGLARGNLALTNGARVEVRLNGGGAIGVTAADIRLAGGSALRAGMGTAGGTAASRAGDLRLDATGTVLLEGASFIANTVATGVTGNAGDVVIDANRLQVTGGSQLVASTDGQGDAGDVRIQVRDRVLFQNQSAAASRVEQAGVGRGGTVQIEAGSLEVRDGAQLAASTAGRGDAGGVRIQVRDRVVIDGESSSGFPSGIFSRISPSGSGAVGDIQIETGSLQISNGASLSAATFGQGNSGNIQILANEQIVLDNGFIASTVSSPAVGQGGTIFIEAGDALAVRNGGRLISNVLGFGDGGDIDIAARNRIILDNGFIASTVSVTGVGRGGDIRIASGDALEVRDGGQLISNVSGLGDGGNIAIFVRDRVLIDGTSADNRFSSTIASTAASDGRGGNIAIDGGTLQLGNGGQLNATTSGSGDGGNIRLLVRDATTLTGWNAPSTIQTSINTSTATEGKGGNISLATSTLSISDNAAFNAVTTSRGSGGNIAVNVAGSLELLNGGQLNATTEASGQTGKISLNADQILISGAGFNNQPSALTVQFTASSAAGEIELNTRRLTLDNQGRIFSLAPSGNGGNLTLNIQDLFLLRRGSQVSVSAGTAQTPGNGGNITIAAPNGFIVGVKSENSDITANAFTGSGGRVNIAAQGIYGLQFRPNPTDFSDITASSTLGVSGTVTLTTPALDPSRGLTELPENIIDTNRILATSCIVRQGSARGTFFITGNGGLPQRPGTPAAPWFPTGTVQAIPDQHAGIPPNSDPIVEMDEIYRLPNGQVILGRACDH